MENITVFFCFFFCFFLFNGISTFVGRPKENFAAILILYKNTTVNVRSADGDIDFYDIVVGVPQGDMLAPYMVITCLDYVLQTSIDLQKENSFTLGKTRSKYYPALTITDADYADDIALMANTLAKAESLLHSLELAAGSIGLHVNEDETDYMRFNQNYSQKLKAGSLKLLGKFTYLGSCVSSTENYIKSWLMNTRTSIDRLSVIRRLDLSDKKKRNFFQGRVSSWFNG